MKKVEKIFKDKMRGQKTPLYIFLVSHNAGGLPITTKHRNLILADVMVRTLLENKVDTFNMIAFQMRRLLKASLQNEMHLYQNTVVTQ